MSAQGLLDARAKLVLLVLAGLWAVLLDHPALLGCAALGAVAALCLSGGGAKRIGWSLAVLGLALWGVAVTQAVFYGRAPRTEWIAWRPEGRWARAIFGPEGLALYREGFAYGLAQGLRLVLAASAGLAVAFSTDAGELLGALSYFRVPPGISFMTVTALRFAPLLSKEAATTWTAARLRGFSPWRAGPFTALGVVFGLMRPVLASCVRRASTLAASALSRGFDPAQASAARERVRFGALSWLVVLAAAMLTLALCAAKALFLAYQQAFFYRGELRPLYEFVRSWL